MSGTSIGVLSGLPMLLFAAAAIPGSVVIARVGALSAVLCCLLITAIAGALRGAASTSLELFAATIVMGAGIAMIQPAIPVIIRQWMPSRMGLGTATYSNGLMVGCLVPVALTLPIIMPIMGDSWRWCLAAWSIPVFSVFLLLAVFAVTAQNQTVAVPSTSFSLSTFGSSLIWKIGLMFGGNNCIFFGTNAFLPAYLTDAGVPHLVTAALTAYNLAHLPGSLAVLMLADRIERRGWPYVCAGIAFIGGIIWLLSATGIWIVVAASMLGFVSGITLSTGLMLPPLLSSPSRIALTAAGMFTLSYTLAMIGMILGGVAWDLTNRSASAFVVLAFSALPLVFVTGTVDFKRDRYSQAAERK